MLNWKKKKNNIQFRIFKKEIDLKLNNCILYYCSYIESGGVICFEYGNNIEL